MGRRNLDSVSSSKCECVKENFRCRHSMIRPIKSKTLQQGEYVIRIHEETYQLVNLTEPTENRQLLTMNDDSTRKCNIVTLCP